MPSVAAINPDFVERYQILYDRDPESKMFAPLAEAYRKMGMLDEAFRVAAKGVSLHPHFPSGRVVFAKVLLDQGDLDRAADELKAAAETSPENILAHSLLAETLTRLRRPKEALKAFKMVLFLNPQDARASKQVKRLESLTADEYEDEAFEMRPLPESVERIRKSQESKGAKRTALKLSGEDGDGLDTQIFFQKKQRALERLISLADAFIVRSDIERAMRVLDDAETQVGQDPEISKRKKLLQSRLQANLPHPHDEEQPQQLKPLTSQTLSRNEASPLAIVESKAQKLTELLHRINDRRKYPSTRASRDF